MGSPLSVYFLYFYTVYVDFSLIFFCFLGNHPHAKTNTSMEKGVVIAPTLSTPSTPSSDSSPASSHTAAMFVCAYSHCHAYSSVFFPVWDIPLFGTCC